MEVGERGVRKKKGKRYRFPVRQAVRLAFVLLSSLGNSV